VYAAPRTSGGGVLVPFWDGRTPVRKLLHLQFVMQHEPQFVMKASDELDRQTLSVPQRRRAGGHAATVAPTLLVNHHRKSLLRPLGSRLTHSGRGTGLFGQVGRSDALYGLPIACCAPRPEVFPSPAPCTPRRRPRSAATAEVGGRGRGHRGRGSRFRSDPGPGTDPAPARHRSRPRARSRFRHRTGTDPATGTVAIASNQGRGHRPIRLSPSPRVKIAQSIPSARPVRGSLFFTHE